MRFNHAQQVNCGFTDVSKIKLAVKFRVHVCVTSLSILWIWSIPPWGILLLFVIHKSTKTSYEVRIMKP